MKDRGIIIPPISGLEIDSDGNCIGWTPIDKGFLRKCVLYWDYIECPVGTLSEDLISNNNELQILEMEGVFTKTLGHYLYRHHKSAKWSLSFFGEHPREFLAVSRLFCYSQGGNDNIHWSIGEPFPISLPKNFDIDQYVFFGNGGKAIVVPHQYEFTPRNLLEKGTVLELHLNNALPEPLPDVRMEEILLFRNTRHAELLDFRFAMDGMYEAIDRAENKEHAIDHAKDIIERSLINLNKVMHQSFPTRLMKSFRPNLTTVSTLSCLLGGALLGKQVDLPELGAAIGFVGSSISFKDLVSEFIPKKVPDNQKDFAYIFYAQEESIITQ